MTKEVERWEVKSGGERSERPKLRLSSPVESVLGLGHKQSIDEVENHQETSADRGGDRLSKGTHRLDVGGVKGSNSEDGITPLLEGT